MALPGIKANTSPTDYRVNKQLQMMKFNGERWELFGPILEDAGPAGWRLIAAIGGEAIGGPRGRRFACRSGTAHRTLRSALAPSKGRRPPAGPHPSRRHASRSCMTARHARAYFGISPNVLPTGSTAWRISRESSTAGLAVLHRFAIDRIADHLDEGGDAWIFGDEAVIPALLLRADQHQLEPALPDDAAAEALEHRAAFAPIGRIGLARRSPCGRRDRRPIRASAPD